MNQPPKGEIALVYPYFREKDPVPKLFPPMGIAYLASQIHELGITATIHDCTFESFPDIIDRIASLKPAIVGISIMVTMSRNAFALLHELRARLPETLFVAGGPLVSVHPTMFASEFDALFLGESDVTFPRFCRDYLTAGSFPGWVKKADVSSYPGLYIVDNGQVRSSPPIHNKPEILETLPIPDRSQFPHQQYQQAMQETTGLRQTSIIITRGCPFTCDFCSKPVWGDAFRKLSLERVFNEIDDIVAYGYDCLWIADDCFTLDTEFLTEFCEEMIRRNCPLHWTCLSRVDRLSPGLANLMKKAGCLRVYLGLESGSNDTLRLMKKNVSVEQGINAVRLFHDAGIGTAGFFMAGYPGETVSSIEKTFALAQALPLDEIWFTIPLPLPGTPLFSRVADIRVWEDWKISNQVKFVYASEFDEDWLRKRIDETKEAFEKARRSRESAS